MTTLQLTVPDMNCGKCVNAIAQAIYTLDPEAQIQADPATKQVQVVTTVAMAGIKLALEQAGYHPTAA
jgi:copper chaperone